MANSQYEAAFEKKTNSVLQKTYRKLQILHQYMNKTMDGVIYGYESHKM